MTDDFDFCVVGAGSAGFSAAVYARELGKTVAIAEGSGDLAGLCILRGCMPAKTMLRSAEVAHLVQEAPQFGVDTENVHIDAAAIVRRKRHIVREFAEERIDGIESFPLFKGRPKFTGRGELTVGEDTIRARYFLVSTGSVIDPPPIPGLRETGYITSDQVLEATRLPKSLVVIGGGPVGCEFAQYFARLGVEVTLLQDAPELLVKEDNDVGAAVRAGLEADGVRVICDVAFEHCVHTDGAKEVHVRRADRTERYAGQVLFLAMTRRPNTEGFDLERAGVLADKRGIRVNNYLQTSNPAIFAAGDVIGRRLLVHLAEYGGRLAVKNAFSEKPVALDFDLHEARGVYTQPEVAVAGLSEKQCRHRGIAYHAASYPFKDHGRAITANLPDGFIKVLAAKDGTILGVTIVGGEAADLVHEALTLLFFRAKVFDIANIPHLHPTMAEIIIYPAEELTKKLSLEEKLTTHV
ncbi:MAG: FAD-dependent oxidoreductase [Candidatus Eremiobacteraeota bacterium]|nr:FAD-dependent oxidoreductase [Candidatus Eremiobacteraeota bacterium]